MPTRTSEAHELKIFTLNCWGLRYVSDHRQVRIKLIAQHLSENDYDVVFLQELWVQSDFEHIRSKTKNKYCFAHMFNNASLLGTSGLVILTKWIPNALHFHPYTINGSPFKPFHGDWFSTKGVAYVRIERDNLNLHLFCTHMHAQYDLNEKINDQYSIHRICQAYELGKFINLMSCNCSKTESKELIILAGDMNTSSKELPYRLLVELTDLNDCYKILSQKETKKDNSLNNNNNDNNNSLKNIRKPKVKDLMENGTFDIESSDDEVATCGHHENTFTPPQNIKAGICGKRIDFIFFKAKEKLNYFENRTNIKYNDLKCKDSTGNGNNLRNVTCLQCVPEKVTIVAKDVSGLSFSDHQPVVVKLLLSSKSDDIFASENVSNFDASPEQDDNLDDIKCSVSKLEMKRKRQSIDEWSQPLCERWKNSQLIQEIECLLSSYIDKFKPSFKYDFIVSTLILMIFAILLGILNYYYTIPLTFTEIFLMIVIVTILTGMGLLLKFITNRTEINAVKAILNDFHKRDIGRFE